MRHLCLNPSRSGRSFQVALVSCPAFLVMIVSTPPGQGGHFKGSATPGPEDLLFCLNPSRSGRSFQVNVNILTPIIVVCVSTPPGQGGHFKFISRSREPYQKSQPLPVREVISRPFQSGLYKFKKGKSQPLPVREVISSK